MGFFKRQYTKMVSIIITAKYSGNVQDLGERTKERELYDFLNTSFSIIFAAILILIGLVGSLLVLVSDLLGKLP